MRSCRVTHLFHFIIIGATLANSLYILIVPFIAEQLGLMENVGEDKVHNCIIRQVIPGLSFLEFVMRRVY